MSNDNTNALLLGGAALGAMVGGFLYKRAHEHDVVEDKVKLVDTPNKTVTLEREIDLTDEVSKVKLTEKELKAAVLTSEMNPIVTTASSQGVVASAHEELPAVLHEVAHPVMSEEIQPVVHRDIKQTEVHQVVQPIYEEYTAPLKEVEKEIAAEVRPTLYEDTTAYQSEFDRNLEQNTFAREATKRETIVKPAIIEENIQKEIIEIVQPVVHRDTIEPTLIHTSAPVYETIVERPVLVHEVRKPIIMTHEQVEKQIHLQQKRPVEKVVEVETVTTVTEKVIPKSAVGKAPLAEAPILK